MIFTILLFVVPIIFLFLFTYLFSKDIEGKWSWRYLGFGFLMSLVSVVVLLTITICVCSSVDDGDISYERTPIYSISRNTQNITSGSFFIGSGYVSGEPYYFVFLENNGAKTIRKIRMDGLTVAETDKEKPYYEITRKKNRASFWIPNWFRRTSIVGEKIVVPSNSIIVNFELR
jgi:hypothetical protein